MCKVEISDLKKGDVVNVFFPTHEPFRGNVVNMITDWGIHFEKEMYGRKSFSHYHAQSIWIEKAE